MDYIFQRPEFTEWTIIVKDRSFDKYQEKQYFEQIGDFEEFSGVFRTSMRDGKECEIFSLLDRNVDHAYLWVNIFKSGDIEYVSHIPSVINTDKRKKRIEILPLVYCNYGSEENTFNFKYIMEYSLTSDIIIESSD